MAHQQHPDDPTPDDDQAAFEHNRQQTLRTFQVLLVGGEVKTVFAHWHDAGASGHLNFVTIGPTGRRAISDSFNTAIWQELHEVHAVDGAPERVM